MHMTYFADGGGVFLLVNQDTARVNLEEFGTHVFIPGTQWTAGPSIFNHDRSISNRLKSSFRCVKRDLIGAF